MPLAAPVSARGAERHTGGYSLARQAGTLESLVRLTWANAFTVFLTLLVPVVKGLASGLRLRVAPRSLESFAGALLLKRAVQVLTFSGFTCLLFTLREQSVKGPRLRAEAQVDRRACQQRD